MAEQVWVLAAITGGHAAAGERSRGAGARQTFTTLSLVFSVITAGWIAVTAHSGGLAVYEQGVGTFALRDKPSLAPAPTLPPATQPAPTALASSKNVSYQRDIKPLLTSKCSECHVGNELKGGFDFSTVASITKGGKKAGAGLVAGKPGRERDCSVPRRNEKTRRCPRVARRSIRPRSP
jgi:hypothetical protein